jgi:hypothetical protein
MVKVDHDHGVLRPQATERSAEHAAVRKVGQWVYSGVLGQSGGLLGQIKSPVGVADEGWDVPFEEHPRHAGWRGRRQKGHARTERHIHGKCLVIGCVSLNRSATERCYEVLRNLGDVGPCTYPQQCASRMQNLMQG